MVNNPKLAERYFKQSSLSTEVERDSNFWIKFKEGNKDAYLFLYNKYAPLLFRYGRKIIRDREAVKDCIHDLFVELWKNKQNLGNPPSVKNYLLKALRTRLFRISKSNKIAYSSGSFEEYDREVVVSTEFNLIHKQFDQEQKDKIAKALSTLTPQQREIIFLSFYNDLKPQEIASIMSLQIRTVYNTLSNALQALKKSMPFTTILIFLIGHLSWFLLEW